MALHDGEVKVPVGRHEHGQQVLAFAGAGRLVGLARHTLSAYDATYIALAEMTDATALLTADARLANAPGIECHIELL